MITQKIPNLRFALNQAFLKVKPSRDSIEKFKYNLINLLNAANNNESEEFHKNLLSDFLKHTYYQPEHFINTKGRNDLVIHNGKTAQTSVGVIIETKRPGNLSEMPNLKAGNFNVKAFHELVLYYLRERISNKNLELKHLIITNLREWYIFDAQLFEKLFAADKELTKKFIDFEEKRLSGVKTDFFYKQIAEPTVQAHSSLINATYFNFRDYEKPLRNSNKSDDKQLIALFKLLSPEHLLKLPFANDSNTLDKNFYSELLHIIGLTEITIDGKKLIDRNKEGQRHLGTMLEDAIIQLDSLDKLNRVDNLRNYGSSRQEQLFSIALNLSITWINRILFLKLLEAQLLAYHKQDSSYSFLNLTKIHGYDDLNRLFFQVLARRKEDRNSNVSEDFEKIPYLNSSLFEPTSIEHQTLFISNLNDNKEIPVYGNTVLKDSLGKKRAGTLAPLEYLFAFLNSYDFSSEGAEDIQEENKTLINASVLGLIFEKINGYKDGSFYTPGMITMFMCRETLRKAVIQKFNTTKGWACEDFNALYNQIENKREANEIINSLTICDPAVGSGHFLVSALNEMIAIKSDLGILLDREGKRLKDYHIVVENDELIVTDEDGRPFAYNPHNKESKRIQETLFHEKQTIIENCLFGVDLNPNSVKICRLRLWIELLKNAYYKSETELETLPNIDINIKEGNSLISRFALDSDLKDALKKNKRSIDDYRVAVDTYRNAQSKEEKYEMETLIASIKSDFKSEISLNDPKIKKFQKLKGDLSQMTNQQQLFEKTKKENSDWEKKLKKISSEIKHIETEIEEIKNNKIYESAFEWRFEFPEVLDEDGNFKGFDVVIGNPPYVQLQKNGGTLAKQFEKVNYQTFERTGDIYSLFYEKGYQILKPQGLLTFITSNKWMRAGYGESTRNFFAENTNPIMLLDFAGQKIFDSATVDTNILMFSKDKNRQQTLACTVKEKVLNNLSDYFRQNASISGFRCRESWVVLNEIEQKIKKKMEAVGTPLKEWNINIYRGILTGYNDAFIIDGKVKDSLIAEDPKSAEIIRPILRGRDIKRYGYEFADLYLLFVPWHFPLHQDPTVTGASKKAENAFKDGYPAVYKHLLRYKPELESRNKAETGIRYEWYALQRWGSNYSEDFYRRKIVWAELARTGNAFTFDDMGYCISNTAYMLVINDEAIKKISYEYLLAALNSKAILFYLDIISTRLDETGWRWLRQYVELIPIPKMPIEQHNQICQTVRDELLTKTSKGQKYLNEYMYKAYNLNEKEIEFIETR